MDVTSDSTKNINVMSKCIKIMLILFYHGYEVLKLMMFFCMLLQLSRWQGIVVFGQDNSGANVKEAHLHRKGNVLLQIYAYYLIWICANNTGTKGRYLLGSAVRGVLHPLRLLWEWHGLFLSYLCRFSGCKSNSILLWLCHRDSYIVHLCLAVLKGVVNSDVVDHTPFLHFHWFRRLWPFDPWN